MLQALEAANPHPKQTIEEEEEAAAKKKALEDAKAAGDAAAITKAEEEAKEAEAKAAHKRKEAEQKNARVEMEYKNKVHFFRRESSFYCMDFDDFVVVGKLSLSASQRHQNHQNPTSIDVSHGRIFHAFFKCKKYKYEKTRIRYRHHKNTYFHKKINLFVKCAKIGRLNRVFTDKLRRLINRIIVSI